MTNLKFTAEDVEVLSGPIAYLYRRGEVVVYVGASAYGLHRPLHPDHKVRKIPEKLNLEIIPCPTASDAFDLEQKLIEEHQPECNVPPRNSMQCYKCGRLHRLGRCPYCGDSFYKPKSQNT